VHDIGSSDSGNFDVLITDVTDTILRTEIAELVSIIYLVKATKEEANKQLDISSGFLYGNNFRPILPCVVSSEGPLSFLHRGHCSPATYLSTQVSVSYI
jgi:hypothetical protein